MSERIPWYLRGSPEMWERRRIIWERHQAGETYTSIARDMNRTVSCVSELANYWRRRLEAIAKEQEKNDKRSPEYGYA